MQLLTKFKKILYMEFRATLNENNHEMNFGNVRVVGHEANYHERLFLEAWFFSTGSALRK